MTLFRARHVLAMSSDLPKAEVRFQLHSSTFDPFPWRTPKALPAPPLVVRTSVCLGVMLKLSGLVVRGKHSHRNMCQNAPCSVAPLVLCLRLLERLFLRGPRGAL